MSEPKLSLRDVTVYRGGRLVLAVEALHLLSGEVLAVLGPNGAGKSTLLSVMALLERPDQGQVLFEGQPVAGNALVYRRRMAVVFQEALLLDASVGENVGTGLRLRGVGRIERQRRVKRWLRRFGIEGRAHRSARKLSGGEAHRVALARAFALEPEVLLLDEPFSALDQPTREALLEELASVLGETGVSTLLVTHDRQEALRLGHRLAVIIDGRIRQVGPVGEVFAAPADEEVAALVGVETVVTGRALSMTGGLVSLRVGDHVVEAVAELPPADEALVCLRAEDVTVSLLNGAVPGLPAGRQASARNRLRGVIQRITMTGAQARITIDCGFPLVALVTRQSLEDLGLEVGAQVTASFKASAVHLIPRHRRAPEAGS